MGSVPGLKGSEGEDSSGVLEEAEEFVYVVGGRSLRLQQRRSNGVGWQLWPASQTLANFLVEFPSMVRDKTVLELGSGCGLCGIVAAVLGATAVELTDKGDVLHNLSRNTEANMAAETVYNTPASGKDSTCADPTLRQQKKTVIKSDVTHSADSVSLLSETAHRVYDGPSDGPRRVQHARCHVRELDWTETPSLSGNPPNVILASDCTYWQHLFAPLCRTLLLTCAPDTVVLLAHEERRPDVEFELFDSLAADFEVQLLLEEESASNGSARRVRLLKLQLRVTGPKLEQRRHKALAQIAFERDDPQSLLARLQRIENDMRSISPE